LVKKKKGIAEQADVFHKKLRMSRKRGAVVRWKQGREKSFGRGDSVHVDTRSGRIYRMGFQSPKHSGQRKAIPACFFAELGSSPNPIVVSARATAFNPCVVFRAYGTR